MNRHHKVLIAVGVFVTMGAVLPGPWRPASLRANRQAPGGIRASLVEQQDEKAVRQTPAGTKIGVPGQKSETDYFLDSQTTRLTARYADATIVTQRATDGAVDARITDKDGNESGRLNVRQNFLQYVRAAGDPFQVVNDSGERPTLEWANRQAYGLLKDGNEPLTWQRGIMRPRRPVARDLEPLELQTEWAQGITAKATRKTGMTVRATINGKERVFVGDVISTRLYKDGGEIGKSLWFPLQQTYIWNLANGSRGVIDLDALSTKNNGPGGWLFSPTAAWVNLQTIAWHHFGSAAPQTVAGGCGPRPGTMARIANFLVPSLSANEPGCDPPFVWLNGTSYEGCCNMHDLCYARFGCTSRTWWMVWTSWTCDVCNLFVVDCFMRSDGGTWNPGDA